MTIRPFGSGNIRSYRYYSSVCNHVGLRSVFFLPEKKFFEPEKIFNILPEKFSNWPRKNLKNCRRIKNCAREKNRKIVTEKKKKPSREKNAKFCPRKLKKYPRKNPVQNIYYEFVSCYFCDCGGLVLW